MKCQNIEVFVVLTVSIFNLEKATHWCKPNTGALQQISLMLCLNISDLYKLNSITCICKSKDNMRGMTTCKGYKVKYNKRK